MEEGADQPGVPHEPPNASEHKKNIRGTKKKNNKRGDAARRRASERGKGEAEEEEVTLLRAHLFGFGAGSLPSAQGNHRGCAAPLAHGVSEPFSLGREMADVAPGVCIPKAPSLPLEDLSSTVQRWKRPADHSRQGRHAASTSVALGCTPSSPRHRTPRGMSSSSRGATTSKTGANAGEDAPHPLPPQEKKKKNKKKDKEEEEEEEEDKGEEAREDQQEAAAPKGNVCHTRDTGAPAPSPATFHPGSGTEPRKTTRKRKKKKERKGKTGSSKDLSDSEAKMHTQYGHSASGVTAPSGFQCYFDSGDFADVQLVSGGRVYPAHRLILANGSDYFAKLLGASGFREHQEREIELHHPDPSRQFPVLLRFLYTGCVNIKADNVLPLLNLSDHYLVQPLKTLCVQFLESRISRVNAVGLLRQALEHHANDIVAQCLLVIARNFSHESMGGVDWSFMPLDTFCKLLQHKYFTPADEFLLYKQVCRYLESTAVASSAPHSSGTKKKPCRSKLHKSETALPSASGKGAKQKNKQSMRSREQEFCWKLFVHVRFRWFTLGQLEEAVANPMVPRDLIVDALMAKLHDTEAAALGTGDTPPPKEKPWLQPRINFARQFPLEYVDGKYSHGVMHWISCGTSKTQGWSSEETSMPKVTASSVEKGTPASLLNMSNPSELWTKDVPASWFQVDLGEARAVVPSHYLLRHGSNYKADSIRSWDFQGSVDGTRWVLLRRHTNDDSLSEAFAMDAWPVEPQQLALRYFRVLQTGHNSSNNNFLVLSGVEIYGELYEGNIEVINAHLASPPQAE